MKTMVNVFRRRFDRLLSGKVQDSYKLTGKLSVPSVCKKCKAVFMKGRWQWASVPPGAAEIICPACRRRDDNFPAGELIVRGRVGHPEYERMIHLIHNEEKKENSRHPLHKIMDEKYDGDSIAIQTTDIHLPLRLGKALKKAYRGNLKIRHSNGDYSVHVSLDL